MPAKKRTVPSGNRTKSKKIRNDPAVEGAPPAAKRSSKPGFHLTPTAIKETLLFFARPANTNQNGYIVKEEAPLAMCGTKCMVIVSQLKDLETLNKEWRYTVGLLTSGRHSVVSAISLLSLDICANNATLESFIETLFTLGEPLVLARVPLMRGLIDVIIEEYQNRPADDMRMRPLIYACDEIPIRYPAIRHDSIESLWRSFDEYHHCETCTTRRKGDVLGSPWLMSCGECSQSHLLAGYTCEEFGHRYAVKYHVRRPDVDDRWLTVELQYGWRTVGPFETHRVDNLVALKMDVSVMHDGFIRMDAFLFLSRRWLDTCHVTCSAWRNHVEEKSDELALRDIYVLSFDRWLRLTLPPLLPDSVCETRLVELKELKRGTSKLSAKNDAFNAEKITRHLQNSFVQYFAHSLHESNDFERLRDVSGVRIGHLLTCRPLQLHVLDSCERFNVSAATFCLDSVSDIASFRREGCFARADEVLGEYFITAKLYYDALNNDVLDAMYHMQRCRRLSVLVGSEYSTENAADLVDLDLVINHFLESDETSGFVGELELISPKNAPLKRPRGCQAQPHIVVDHLLDAEHLPGKQYEVYEFPCKKTSDVLTVIRWTSLEGRHVCRLQRGPFSA